jgi:hypothetical protein
LFRPRVDQIINMKHELVVLVGKIDWDWIDGGIAPLYGENGQRGIENSFMIGRLSLLDAPSRSHRPERPLSLCDPHSENFRPARR